MGIWSRVGQFMSKIGTGFIVGYEVGEMVNNHKTAQVFFNSQSQAQAPVAQKTEESLSNVEFLMCGIIALVILLILTIGFRLICDSYNKPQLTIVRRKPNSNTVETETV